LIFLGVFLILIFLKKSIEKRTFFAQASSTLKNVYWNYCSSAIPIDDYRRTNNAIEICGPLLRNFETELEVIEILYFFILEKRFFLLTNKTTRCIIQEKVSKGIQCFRGKNVVVNTIKPKNLFIVIFYLFIWNSSVGDSPEDWFFVLLISFQSRALQFSEKAWWPTLMQSLLYQMVVIECAKFFLSSNL
jgi:hypothetical protein